MPIRHRIRRLESVVQSLGLPEGWRPKPAPRQLQTAQDVVDLLQEQVEAVRAEPWAGTLEKARAIDRLADTARKAIEASSTAARIELLETILKQRKGDGQR